MTDEVLGGVLRRFLASRCYWSTEWSGDGAITLDGRLDGLTEEEIVAVRSVGLDTWERVQGVERTGPR
jgi:hypothetical protein